MDRKIRSQIKRFAAIVTIMAGACTLQAGSATWNLNAVNNHWNKAANWTPATVPYGENDVATFGASNVTDPMLGVTPNGDAGNILGGIVFGAGASAYTITMTAVYGQTSYLAFYGAGIINNSGITQNLVAGNSGSAPIDSARIYFQDSASAGENVVITNQGSASPEIFYGAGTSFWTGSGPSAGTATIINEGCTVSGPIRGGITDFLFSSRAESATLINNPGSVSGAAAGDTLIQTQGDLGTSTFINNAATVPGAEGGWTEFDYGITSGTRFIANGASLAGCQGGQVYAFGAGYGTGEGLATYTANGGNGSNAEGGLIDVLFVPANAQTIVRANGGTNGGLGGTILIEDSADIPLPQFQVFGNGVLDLTNVTDPTMPIGSLAGNGKVLLAGHSLSIGNNNLSTTFSGVIQESGGLTKAGTGTLTLTGGNTYTGATSVTAGTLRVTNQSGSATGTGPVKATAGTLGGSGIIAGKVTIGDGSATPAFVEPSVGANTVAQLTIQRLLTFKADGTYIYKLNTNNARADQVIAKGVTIESGAQFNFQAVSNRILTIGTVFTAINNTSANPITGTFANLPDNSTFTAGRNNYQVSYSGGDGNDLTLTVVP
jgi:autotransporter-associated beta strand protein